MRSVAICLLIAFIGSITAADPYKCNSGQVINPPANISLPVLLPNGWNSTESPWQYASGQNCSWVVSVPVGMFAFVTIKSETTLKSTLSIINSIGGKTRLGGDYSQEPFFFNSPLFIINLDAQTTGRLGIRIAWFNYPAFTPIKFQVHQQGDPVVVPTEDLSNATIFTADTKVSLVGLPTQNVQVMPYMRATFIFDGPSWNSTFLGTLDDCIASLNQCVSTGKQLTVFTVWPGLLIGSHVLIQDFADTKDFVQYRGLVCVISNNCQTSVQAFNGKAAIVTYTNSPYYLKSATISELGTLKVYYKKLQGSNLVKTYTHNQTQNSFPQKFAGLLTTYVVDRDPALFTFSTSSNDAKWNQARDGRVGFITSDNFLNPMTFNYGNEQISGNDNYKYSLSFRQTGITGAATLRLTVLNKDKTTYDQTFTKDHPAPNEIIVAQGNTFKVDYKANGAITTGFFLDFNIQKAASSYGLIVSLLVSLIAFAQV